MVSGQHAHLSAILIENKTNTHARAHTRRQQQQHRLIDFCLKKNYAINCLYGNISDLLCAANFKSIIWLSMLLFFFSSSRVLIKYRTQSHCSQIFPTNCSEREHKPLLNSHRKFDINCDAHIRPNTRCASSIQNDQNVWDNSRAMWLPMIIVINVSDLLKAWACHSF